MISIATLSHQVVAHPSPQSVLRYVGLLVPVWWVWNQFTWYASHFDNDDFWFRAFMLSGVAGTLLLAGGLHDLSHPSQFILAYVFLHVILALGWLRAHGHVPPLRPYIRFKLTGIGMGIGIWTASLWFSPPSQFVVWAVGVCLQLLLPVFAWATVKEFISVHHHHLTERHGLFAIIVLGESLVALTAHLHPVGWSSLPLAGLFLVVLSLWWIYFDWRYDPIDLRKISHAFGFNYGHFLLYASLGVVAAGIGIFPSSSVQGLMVLELGLAAFLLSLSMMGALSSQAAAKPRLLLRTAIGVVCLALVPLAPILPAGAHLIALTAGMVGLATAENHFSRAETRTKNS